MKIGKKGKTWFEAKRKLKLVYLKKGITACERILPDGRVCNSDFALSFHHLDKRSSGKAKHTFKETRLLCVLCHQICEYNRKENEKLRKLR